MKYRLSALFLSFLFLVSCGGNSGNGPYSVSPGSINFYASDPSGATPVSQTVRVTANSGIIVLGEPVIGGIGISSVDQNITGETTAEITIYPIAPNVVGVGTHRASVSVIACADSNCTRQIDGSPQVVEVVYRVDGFSTNPTSVNLNSVEGENSAQQNINISHTAGSLAWNASVSYVTGSDWLVLGAQQGNTLPANLGVSGGQLSAGTYNANINITSNSGNTSIPVTYTVQEALAVSQSRIDFVVGNNPTAAQLTQTITISSNYPAASNKDVQWTANSNVAWLTVTPSGNTSNSNQMNVTIEEAGISAFLNGTQQAMITLSSTDAFVSNLQIPVSMVLDRTQVNYVAPYAVIANTSDTVIIRGNKFDDVNITAVRFGANQVNQFTQVSDSELRVQHPSLSSGSYPVEIATDTGEYASLAELKVMPPLAATATTLNSSGSKNLFYDTERQALWLFHTDSADVERFQYNNNQWSNTTITLPFHLSIAYSSFALTPDGKEFFLVTQNETIARLDANTMSVIDESAVLVNYPQTLNSISVLNDGTVLVVRSGGLNSDINIYDAEQETLTPVANSQILSGSVGHVTADGSKVMYFGGNIIRVFNASDKSLTTLSNALPSSVLSINKDGTRNLYSYSRVYDADFAQLGSLPNTCIRNSIISYQGNRVFSHCQGIIEIYDLTATPNPNYPLVGSPIRSSTFVDRMAVSTDGGILFVADSPNLQVIVLP